MELVNIDSRLLLVAASHRNITSISNTLVMSLVISDKCLPRARLQMFTDVDAFVKFQFHFCIIAALSHQLRVGCWFSRL